MRESSSRRYLESICFRAIVIATLVVVAAIFASRPNSEARQNAAKDNSQPSTEQQKKSESFWERTTTDPVAAYTGVLALFTAALVIVSGFQIYFLNRTDETARLTAEAALGANEQTAKLFIADQRPWVDINVSATDKGVLFRHDGIRVPLTVTIKNLGKTPAINVAVGPLSLITGLEMRTRFDELRDHTRENMQTLGKFLFPNQVDVEEHVLQITNEQIEQSHAAPSFQGRGITIIVKYANSLNSDIYETSYVAMFGIGSIMIGLPRTAGETIARDIIIERANFMRVIT